MSVLPREEECGHLTTTEEDNVTGTTQLQSIYLSLWLSKVISHKAYLIIKCCVSHKSFEYCAESENRMLVRGQNGSKCAGRLPSRPVAAGMRAQYRVSPPSPGKGPNSKVEVQFLLNVDHFCIIIQSKSC